MAPRRKIPFSPLFDVSAFVVDHWTWIASFVAGLALSWLAHITEFLKPYAPFSWGLAFLVGFLCFMWVIAGASAIAQQWAKRGFWNHVQSIPDRDINALDRAFDGKRISLEQTADPSTRIIRGKTFTECELLGRRLTFFFNGCNFIGQSSFNGVDLVSMAIEQGQQTPRFENTFVFDHCTFQTCKFYYATMIFPEHTARLIVAGAGNAKGWIVAPR